jgi:hypothetical protein
MDNLRRVLVGLEPIPHEAVGDKAIAEAFAGTGLLEGYDPGSEDEPEREQATLEDF